MFSLFSRIFAQSPHSSEARADLRIMFYNVENLFDTIDDSLHDDEDFLPGGKKKWRFSRYKKKLKNIYKVIVNAGGPRPPEIIGLCEVENKKVLEDLLLHTPLNIYSYEILHAESEDKRGIDVALLYAADSLSVLSARWLKVDFGKENNERTRDILHATLLVYHCDTIDVFVNHWPSRRGGKEVTEKKRLAAAHTLIKAIVDVRKQRSDAKIVVMGDFNDEPDDLSMQTLAQQGQMQNLSTKSQGQKGTIRFEGQWSLFDQILVSDPLINASKKLYCQPEDFRIFAPPYLLIADEKYLGYKPAPTYNGRRYQGGYSDHLPIILDLWKL
mgnify:CR=1 FL=1